MNLRTKFKSSQPLIQTAAWEATPPPAKKKATIGCPISVRQKILEKRQLRRIWKTTRHPEDKRNLNRASRQLKELLKDHKNNSFQEYLQNLTPTAESEYALWKATKKLKQLRQHIPPLRNPYGNWARTPQEKADTFSDYLEEVFKPIPPRNNDNDEERIRTFLDETMREDQEISLVTVIEIKTLIKHDLNPKKASGYDLITGEIIKNLPHKAVKMLMQFINAVIRLKYFPAQWKIAEVILIQKPGKPANEPSSYRPISLLPVMSKIAEKLVAKRLIQIISQKNIIPDHQFGFRRHHSTIEQVHRVVDTINKTFEKKSYCASIFLDVSQAFDKVWHYGLLYKLNYNLPEGMYTLLSSYLAERYFRVRYEDLHTRLHPISAGVPQGSVLGPILYLIFTADLPTNNNITTSTFADDTAILAVHQNPEIAVATLQQELTEIENWAKKWRIRINETKSNYIVFTKCRGRIPPVTLNNKPVLTTDCVRYLGMHLDKSLTWKTHIWNKRKQLGLKFKKHYWLLGRKSALTIRNKILVYNTIFKPVWTYGLQLWGTASKTNLSIIERFQSKTLRTMCDAPWFVTNKDIYSDLEIQTVSEVIVECSKKYISRLEDHPNVLALNLLDNSEDLRRLKRKTPLDLIFDQ